MPHDDASRRSSKTPASHPSTGMSRPADHAFMSCDSWLDFHCELYDVVAELDLRVTRIEPGVIRLADGRSLPLLPLVEQCHERPREDWHGLIERYLDGLVQLLGPPMRSMPLSSIDLRVRLVPATPLDEPVLSSVGARMITSDIAAVLSVADGREVRTVAADELAAIDLHPDDAWTSAWQQTEMLVEPEEVDAVDLDGVEILHLFGSSEFTASLVCSLEQHLGPLGPDGAIVAIPCDHTVLVHSIVGPDSRRAIGTLVPIVRRIHADGPGPLSPQLYWWRNGRLTWIPTVFGGEVNEVYLPAGLSDAIS